MNLKLALLTTAALALPLAFSSTSAQAISKNVSSAKVDKGYGAIKLKGEVEIDDDKDTNWKNKAELKYGITDRVELAIEGEAKKKESKSLEYYATKLKVKYQLTDKDYMLKSAIQGKYEKKHSGGTDALALKLNLQKSAGKWDQRANFEIGHEVGDGKESGIDAGMKFASYYKMNGYKIGGEYYADFGRLKDLSGWDAQQHHIGPVVGFYVPAGDNKVATKIGYLAGISNAAADHIVTYEMKYKFSNKNQMKSKTEIKTATMLENALKAKQ